MIYIESHSNDPRFNLALEQYVFDEMDRSREYFMLWQNKNTIVVGKHQNTTAEINQEYVYQNDIRVVRRLSGGGAVYHDMGNLNFTFVMNSGNTEKLNFELFCEPVVSTLRGFGIQAEINGRNDIVIDGKKFSGNSQYIKQGRVMHHGTIMFDSDLLAVEQALKVSKDKIESKGVQSVRSRVTNVASHLTLPVSLVQFKEALLRNMFENSRPIAYPLTEKDLFCVQEIKRKKYDQWEWNYGKSPACNIQKRRRLEGVGEITLYLDVDKGVIRSLQATGDFFGSGEIADISHAVAGYRMEEVELTNALRHFNIGHYFHNLNLETFVRMIVR